MQKLNSRKTLTLGLGPRSRCGRMAASSRPGRWRRRPVDPCGRDDSCGDSSNARALPIAPTAPAKGWRGKSAVNRKAHQVHPHRPGAYCRGVNRIHAKRSMHRESLREWMALFSLDRIQCTPAHRSAHKQPVTCSLLRHLDRVPPRIRTAAAYAMTSLDVRMMRIAGRRDASYSHRTVSRHDAQSATLRC